jgi:hypothetical protein
MFSMWDNMFFNLSGLQCNTSLIAKPNSFLNFLYEILKLQIFFF